ncbi:MAG: D-glycero-beta-D-manno-heptose-7-phosphate kinase, partial [Planctomycetes bacterium]|nr:D-glycero-beta-D-manno-heptose-7-phosphate kinase [Planctomycetota bacterium]
MIADLLQIVNDRSPRHLVVVGDIILDHYVRGDVSRISPEAPIPVVAVKDEEAILGGAANVAANIVSMGASAELIGVLGDDQSGKTVKRLAKSLRG